MFYSTDEGIKVQISHLFSEFLSSSFPVLSFSEVYNSGK